MLCQYVFRDCDKCIALVQDFVIGEAGCIMDSEGIQELSIPSIQFCSKSKTAVKKTPKLYIFKNSN